MTTDYKFRLAALIKQARTDLLTYILLMNNPETSRMIIGKLHQYLADVVQEVVDGTRKPYQTVSVPPQHGKTSMLIGEAVSWIMGRRPGIEVAITGHRHDLMTEWSMKVRDRVQSRLYRLVFPDAGNVVRGHNRSDFWRMENRSLLRAKSVGSKLTGSRVDWLVVDDAHAGRAEAESITERNKVHRWFEADCLSRLSPGAKVFVVGTRWHPDDLIGRLTDEEYVAGLRAAQAENRIFEVTNLPAVAEMGDDDPLGREPGQALFPEVRNAEWLRGQKAALPSYEWQSQYQGNPRSVSSGQVDLSKIIRITEDDVPLDIPRCRGWDFALTEKKTSDYTAGPLCAYDPVQDRLYLMNMVRHRKPWPMTKAVVLTMAGQDLHKWNATRMAVEAVSGFEIGLQELNTALSGKVSVEARNPRPGGKLMRAQGWLNLIEAGRFYMVSAPWNRDFLDELEVFPGGAHDDQVDGISIAYESLTGSRVLYA